MNKLRWSACACSALAVGAAVGFLAAYKIKSKSFKQVQEGNNNHKQKGQKQGRRLVGILGGLGPEASALLMKLIVEEGARSGAVHDNEHASVLCYVKPELPNSRLAVIGRVPSPLTGMVSAVKAMQAAGATEVCCACVTAHNFFPQAAESAGVPLMDMIAITAHKAVSLLRRCGDKGPLHVGLLSTDATIKSCLFQKAIAKAALKQYGVDGSKRVQVVIPDNPDIPQHCILSIKAGRKVAEDRKVSEILLEEAEKLVLEKGAKVIITGCTELPLAFSKEIYPDFCVPVLDPLKCLAREIVSTHMNEKSRTVKTQNTSIH